jgi:hypothetical protein
VVTTINQLQVKLTAAKGILAQINELKGQSDYKSAEEIDRLVTQAEEKISKSLKIQAEIEELKLKPSYLDASEIKLGQKMLDDAAKLEFFR